VGSYAKISIDNGVLKEFQVQDIYVPDGQFKGYVKAPPGAKEYLSGGKGLRLPDANWHPDFQVSAQQILNYFSWSDERNIDGVIAVNLPVVNKLLKITGPIYLPDYDAYVTANNFADIARADRNSFFPGSQQKQHFLSIFINQLIFKLESLNTSDMTAVFKTLANQAKEKNILFFSTHNNIENLFKKLGIAGQLSLPSDQQVLTLMSVESNVGINKANQHLSRAFNIKINQDQSMFEIFFTNNNPKRQAGDKEDSLNYINYQRILTNPRVNINQILVDEVQVEQWDESIIENAQGVKFKQIGFLVEIPEKTSKVVKIYFNQPSSNTMTGLFLIKQPGVESVPVSLNFNNQLKSFTLEKDTLVEVRK
jgi:hypothetical protein